MATFKLVFEADNAAFDDGDHEMVRILRDVTERVEVGDYNGIIRDSKGNKVGEFSLEN